MGFSKSGSSSSETTLTKEQGKLLKEREKQYQAYFFPRLVGMLEEAESGKLDPGVAQAAAGTERAFRGAQTALDRSIAQRGLQDSGVGVLGQAQLFGTKASALSNLYQTAASDQFNKRAQLLQMGGSLAPTPTTATPMKQQSSASGFSLGG